MAVGARKCSHPVMCGGRGDAVAHPIAGPSTRQVSKAVWQIQQWKPRRDVCDRTKATVIAPSSNGDARLNARQEGLKRRREGEDAAALPERIDVRAFHSTVTFDQDQPRVNRGLAVRTRHNARTVRLKKLYSSREVASLTGLARQLQWWHARRLFVPDRCATSHRCRRVYRAPLHTDRTARADGAGRSPPPRLLARQHSASAERPSDALQDAAL